MTDVNYFAPTDLGEAVRLMAANKDGLKVLAGGTDVMPKINYYTERPASILYVGGLGLDYIKADGGNLVIGAGTPIAKILTSAAVAKDAACLVQAASEHSSPAIRSVGTIGGNIMNASPAADTVAPLYALDAELLLVSANGERTVKIEAFFTGPGQTVCDGAELLKEIRIPKASGNTAFVKLGKRKAQVLAVVSAAVRLNVEGGVCKDARVALGSVAPTVIRCTDAEAMLEGQTLTADLLRDAAEAAMEICTPIDDARATAWYRKEAGKGIVRQALFAAAGLEYID